MLSNIGIVLDLNGIDPDIRETLVEVFNRRPECKYPVGTTVRVKLSWGEIYSSLKKNPDFTEQDARDFANIFANAVCEVIGVQTLTDDDGIDKTFNSVMSNEGIMFPFRETDLEKVG